MSKASNASMKDRKREAAEQSLLDAAEAEFAASGFAAASMQSIAARAGVSVGTLYNYFKDKDDLVTELSASRRKALAAKLDTILDAPGPFEAQMRLLVTTLFRHFDEHRAYLRVSIHLDQSLLKRKAPANLMTERLQRIVDQGVKEGVVRANAAPIAVSAMAAIIKAILIERVDGKGSFIDMADDTVDLILHGVGNK